VAPLEPWEKVLVEDDFVDDVHGQVICTVCHEGQQSPDKDEAHAGLISDPSALPNQGCQMCHSTQAETFETSLHSTLDGYWKAIDERSVPEDHEALEGMFGNHCSSCHATCGDCHISQPNSVGGGFIAGHNVKKTPSMTRNCTACHGSRVGSEYLGKHEGISGDIHFRQGRMNCVDCHSGMEMHDSTGVCTECHDLTEDADLLLSNPDRYTGAEVPACGSCHEEAATSNPQHILHQDKLSCQVCHSVSYTSCDGCHVAVSEESGNPFFETEGTYLTFFIGKNPNPSYHRPYEYVPVRHVPVDTESYAFYGENLLSNFDARPTWAYATPHNIQRITPQNESCEACHGNADIFLTADKVSPAELEANQSVIVDEIPPLSQ
jgi:hypothetical protein